ncbi:unnamed protein product, partial [Ectocarpus sp. 12 AP-2014]
MDKEQQLVEELVKNALYRIDENTRMIKKSLIDISEEELWQQPNSSLNSIANLILHICGNMTQYVISSLGETEDKRNRDAEFAIHNGKTKAALLVNLEN